MGHRTHLTVYWDCGIKADHVENYGQKGGHARQGVNLQQGKVQSSVVGWTVTKRDTNPYCPSVRAMPSDDIPLIVKGSEEFPSRRGGVTAE